MSDYKVALFGLGAMGFGMANALCRSGLTTYGFDLDTAAETRFRECGGAIGDLDKTAPFLDAAVIVVVNAEQTETVLFGKDGIAGKLAPGTVIIACATVAPDFARAMEARCIERDLLYLDAPISGGTA